MAHIPTLYHFMVSRVSIITSHAFGYDKVSLFMFAFITTVFYCYCVKNHESLYLRLYKVGYILFILWLSVLISVGLFIFVRVRH